MRPEPSESIQQSLRKVSRPITHRGKMSAAPSIMDHAMDEGKKWNIPRHKDQRVTRDALMMHSYFNRT